jgi:serine/threonine-protein kinase
VRISSGAAVLCACWCACSLQACGNSDDAAGGSAASANGAGSPGAGVGTGGASTQGGTGTGMNGGTTPNSGGSATNPSAGSATNPNGGASNGGSSNATAGSASAGTTGTGGNPQTGMGPFPSSAPFYQDISKAKLDGESGKIMKALGDIGWGDADKRTQVGIDFSFNINVADVSVVKRAFTKTPKYYSPDCDFAPVPLPLGGKGEGVDNYECNTGDDCHLLVYQGSRYYELYQSNISGGLAAGGIFVAQCLVIWDLTKDYWVPQSPPNFSRGDGCTGGDAADLPMAPLVLTKADLASGNIKHALRFTIDNNRIAADVYVHPATHYGGPTGGTDMMPYGARLRLRGDYPLASLPNDHARTVAKALQTYGMFMADGGNIYISATTDASDLINNSILSSLKPTDFEMIDGGPRLTGQDCKHVPLTQ